MALTENSRLVLYQRLKEVLGGDEATTLMEYLPPVGWADVATKRDLDNLEERLRAEFKQEIAVLRAELKAELAELRVDMANLRTELAGLGTEFASALNRQTYRFVGFTTAIVVGAGFLN